jgi:hypothetical protein
MPKRYRLLTAVVLGACALGVVYLVLQRHTSPTHATAPLLPAPNAIVPSESASASAVPHATAPLLPEPKPVLEHETVVQTPETPAVLPAHVARPTTAPTSTPSGAHALRPRPVPVPVIEPTAPVVVQTPPPTAAPTKPSGSRRVEAGADLGVPRRESPTPIDLDNPYR